MSLLTFQDFEKSDDKMAFMVRAITEHELSPLCRTARDADLYDRQKNKTIYNKFFQILAAMCARLA